MGIVGVLFGYGTSALAIFISNYFFPYYDNKGIDKELRIVFGDKNWNDIITEDLFIVAFSYNEKEPRFYSKWFINNDPGTYSVDIKNASASSSAAPLYFYPNHYINGFGIEEFLIDGGLIATDPALYAF